MAGKDAETCSILDEAATIQPPRLEDAGLEDCALPLESIMEAFARAAFISSGPRANDIRMAGKDVEACSISDEAATIQPPRLEDAGLEDCALPLESIMEAFAHAAVISSGPRANDIRMAGKDVEACSISDEAATIQPPRLEDAGLEDCALPIESIMEAFARAAIISSSPRANDEENAEEDEANTDIRVKNTMGGSRR